MGIESIDIPPAKRQRTLSPRSPVKMAGEAPTDSEVHPSQTPLQPLPPQPEQNIQNGSSASPNASTTADILSIPGLGRIGTENNLENQQATQEPVEDFGILDALMQHVESESRPAPSKERNEEIFTLPKAEKEIVSIPGQLTHEQDSQDENQPEGGKDTIQGVEGDVQPSVTEIAEAKQLERQQEHVAQEIPVASDQPMTDTAVTSEALDDTLDAITTTRGDASAEGAEWEIDSSPLESSSGSEISSDTSSEDDSDDEDGDGDYAMLDPEEQARILMQGDGGSDDEGGTSKDKANAAPLRTANERPEEIIPKPNIVVTDEMAIEELGEVEGVVENTVLVKAKVSGDYQVLEHGSLLCTADRTVVGVVAETLGRVEQPRYTIRFTNDKAIEEAGLSVSDNSAIYYVLGHSTFVFTRPLRAVKGSDASNFHDEEVGDEEMEFSDDEAEAEHKRRLKLKRQGKRDERGGRGHGNRGGRGNPARNERVSNSDRFPEDHNGTAYGNGSLEINYDDKEGADDGYTPLARPANFQEMMASSPTLETTSNELPPLNHRGSGGRGHNRGHNQGGRGGRGGRGRRGWDRSNSGSERRRSFTNSNEFGNASTPPNPNFIGMHNASTFEVGNNTAQPVIPHPQMAPPHNPFQYQPPPRQPLLPPQNSPYPNFPFSPSPISPLPKQQFDFAGYNPQQAQQQQRYQGAGQYAALYPPQMPPPSSHFNPGFMQNFVQQQQQQQGPPPPGAYGSTMGWTGNQAAAAEVQAQLEQLRRNNGAQ